MDLKLQNKRALITGSTTGIGEEIARVFAEEGVAVAIHGRNQERAEKVAAEIKQAGGTAIIVLGDLTSDADAERVAQTAVEMLGGIDILVNNAGAYPLTGWWDTPADVWLDTYNTDVIGGVRLVKLLVPAMIERGWGRVIQIASKAGTLVPANYFPPYAGAKAGQVHIAGSLAVELGGTGVTSNSISPGPVATGTFKDNYTDLAKQAGRSTNWEDIQKWYIDQFMPDAPLPRLTTMREIADMAAFLASPRADATTGGDFVVDGGVGVTGFKRQPTELPTGEASLYPNGKKTAAA